MAKAKEKAKVEKTDKKKKGKAAEVETKAAEDKAAKKAARLAKIKERPDGQRTNSKQIDVIDLPKGSVQTFAHTVRKYGVLITSVALSEDGEVLGVSTTVLPGYKPKSKKGHGSLVPGIPGVGKKGQHQEEEDEDGDED